MTKEQLEYLSFDIKSNFIWLGALLIFLKNPDSKMYFWGSMLYFAMAMLLQLIANKNLKKIKDN